MASLEYGRGSVMKRWQWPVLAGAAAAVMWSGCVILGILLHDGILLRHYAVRTSLYDNPITRIIGMFMAYLIAPVLRMHIFPGKAGVLVVSLLYSLMVGIAAGICVAVMMGRMKKGLAWYVLWFCSALFLVIVLCDQIVYASRLESSVFLSIAAFPIISMPVSFAFDVWRCMRRKQSLGVELMKIPLGILLGLVFYVHVLWRLWRW